MPKGRTYGVDRLAAFSDGVVAIAITLLVLPLAEIDPPAGSGVVDVLVAAQTNLFTFALSFVVIANYWAAHHAIFRVVLRHDTRLLQLNMLWLASIVFIPFPTALIGDDLGFTTLYIASLLATSALTLLLTSYLARHPELLEDDQDAEIRRHVTVSWSTVVVLTVAVAISVVSDTAGLWALLVLGPAQVIASQGHRRRYGSAPEPSS